MLELKFWTKERTDLPSPRIEVLRLVEKGRIQVHCCNHRKHFPPTRNVIPFIKFWRKKAHKLITILITQNSVPADSGEKITHFNSILLPLYRTSFRAFLCRNLTTFPSLSVSLITFTCHYRMFLYGTISNRILCFFFFFCFDGKDGEESLHTGWIPFSCSLPNSIPTLLIASWPWKFQGVLPECRGENIMMI